MVSPKEYAGRYLKGGVFWVLLAIGLPAAAETAPPPKEDPKPILATAAAPSATKNIPAAPNAAAVPPAPSKPPVRADFPPLLGPAEAPIGLEALPPPPSGSEGLLGADRSGFDADIWLKDEASQKGLKKLEKMRSFDSAYFQTVLYRLVAMEGAPLKLMDSEALGEHYGSRWNLLERWGFPQAVWQWAGRQKHNDRFPLLPLVAAGFLAGDLEGVCGLLDARRYVNPAQVEPFMRQSVVCALLRGDTSVAVSFLRARRKTKRSREPDRFRRLVMLAVSLEKSHFQLSATEKKTFRRTGKIRGIEVPAPAASMDSSSAALLFYLQRRSAFPMGGTPQEANGLGARAMLVNTSLKPPHSNRTRLAYGERAFRKGVLSLEDLEALYESVPPSPPPKDKDLEEDQSLKRQTLYLEVVGAPQSREAVFFDIWEAALTKALETAKNWDDLVLAYTLFGRPVLEALADPKREEPPTLSSKEIPLFILATAFDPYHPATSLLRQYFWGQLQLAEKGQAALEDREIFFILPLLAAFSRPAPFWYERWQKAGLMYSQNPQQQSGWLWDPPKAQEMTILLGSALEAQAPNQLGPFWGILSQKIPSRKVAVAQLISLTAAPREDMRAIDSFADWLLLLESYRSLWTSPPVLTSLLEHFSSFQERAAFFSFLLLEMRYKKG